MPETSDDAHRVLVVDDDEALAENLAEILESLAVRVDVTRSAREANAAAAKADYALALVDLRLPDGNGIGLIAELRKHSPSTEVILITGDATVETAIAAVRDGAFAYVTKPFSPPDLIETTRRALAQVAVFRERERLRRELERSERKHRELVEAVPAFVLALDGAGRIATWNRRLEEVTGFSRDEMIGKDGASFLRGEGSRPLPMKAGAGTVRTAAADRLVRWERAQVSTGEQEPWTYAVGIDVTNEELMRRRTLRAERLAAVGTMAAGLAHEIRNPLNSAQLQLTLLMRRMDRADVTPQTLRPVAEVVQAEIARLERLVNDFLAFAQPRPLAVGQTDLNELCRATGTFVEAEAAQAGSRIALELDPQLGMIDADGERLRQVLLNLVRNAIEAMPAGGTVTLRTRRAGDQVELDVEDTGVGIPDEVQIFDAFYTTKPQGTGLGLSIVHRIIGDHGGSIRLRSRPGCTAFTIVLPARA